MTRDDRTRVADAPRSATGREWEVFVRETADGALKHVGSVTAPDADGAHDYASRLFDWVARDVWLCPADETRRYATHSLGDPGEASATDDDAERGDSAESPDDDVERARDDAEHARDDAGRADDADSGGESA